MQYSIHKNKKKSRNYKFTQIFAALDDLKIHLVGLRKKKYAASHSRMAASRILQLKLERQFTFVKGFTVTKTF